MSELLGVTGSKADPTVLYNNPASIGDLGRFKGTVGTMYIQSDAKRSGGAAGTSDSMNTGNHLVPNIAAVGSAMDGKIGFGMAVVSPYGLSTQWSDTSNVRYVATKSTLQMIDVSPAVSVRPVDKIAVGLGADYFSTFDADLQKKVAVDALNFAINGSAPVGSADANSRLWGGGRAWGYHTGILFNPTPSHTIGLVYHSAVKTKIEGDIELDGLSGASAFVFGGPTFRTHARTDLFYPQNVQMGYKYSHEDKWEAGFNVAWYNWSQNNQLAIQTPDANAVQKSILQQPIPLQWRDVWSGTVGGFYRFTEHFKLNAGAYYLPYVYPDASFTPAVPDTNKIGVSVGPSFNVGGLTVDTVYNPLFYLGRSVTNTQGQAATGSPAADISGKYKAFVQIVGINLGWKF